MRSYSGNGGTRQEGRILVVFEEAEAAFAEEMGLMRQLAGLAMGGEHRDAGTFDDVWQHQKGCIGEAAVNFVFGRPWDPTIGEIRRGDGPVEVRCTTQPDRYGLPVYQHRDDPWRPYVLAWWNMKAPLEVLLMGWAWGYEVTVDEFHADPRYDKYVMPTRRIERRMPELVALWAASGRDKPLRQQDSPIWRKK